ncbi:MAG: tRNA 2-thiouridine(34) synthase MnmA [Bacteroidota bacterium]|nr:tRNA 2-thiouridine(34) synthase MnmA [Bacteroidota bacterium]MDP4206018.1 tRNA 2-thiouridine(34) synthase MnmA [Bacteroidota bacterium]
MFLHKGLVTFAANSIERQKLMTKVAVGLSGGVDSSVAAYLLKQQGYDVIALFMINWKDNTTGLKSASCTYEDDVLFAQMVARKLEIPFHIVDHSEDYSKRVVDYMFSEYEAGRTPNPDVLCNREIKFDVFMKKALEFGVDYVATGHYCRKETFESEGKQIHKLLAGVDSNKDQSYFLCQLTQNQLAKAMFPIGHLLKPEVREIARREGLATSDRKDSQGICFVGKVDLPTFLQQKLTAKEGDVIEIPKTTRLAERKEETLEEMARPYPFRPWHGKVIGKHQGAHYYTIGQRKGLNIGGRPEPLFILNTDVERNFIYVGQGHDHPCLSRKALHILTNEVHWIREDLRMLPGEERSYQVRIRYRQPLAEAKLYCREEGLYIVFEEKQRAVVPGQFAAWYDGDELIGSGVINQ